jgi:glyoxylase I family protein
VQPLGIHHVSLNVGDVDRSRTFYLEVLGGTERADRPDFGFGGAWIDLGDQQVHLIEAPVPANLGQHLAIAVADLAGVVAELRERGIAVGDPSPVGSSLQAFVTDPDGNLVELHEVGGAGSGGSPPRRAKI